MSYCKSCERHFDSGRALKQHLQTSSRHAWCNRCERSFASDAAKLQHMTDSSAHHICNTCPDRLDFTSGSDLDEHLTDSHHYCTRCEEFFGSSLDLTSHNEDNHNPCPTCGALFLTSQNLKAVCIPPATPDAPDIQPRANAPQHGLTHMPKTVECCGCENMFVSTSAMLLHLESGFCVSQTDAHEVHDLALQCFQSKYYTSPYDHSQLECPGCDRQFSRMSALFQHVESDCCDAEATPSSPLGKCLRFLNSRI
jgi:hypothetical protein